MADRHRRVALQQQKRDRLADEVRASDDDRLGALERNRHSCRAARSRQAACTAAARGVPCTSRPTLIGVSPSTSFSGRIAAVSCRAVEALGHGQLKQDPADRRIAVALLDHRGHVVLGGVGGEVAVEVGDPDLGARLALVGDVDRRRGIVADEDRGEPGRPCRIAPRSPTRRAPPRRGRGRRPRVPSMIVAGIVHHARDPMGRGLAASRSDHPALSPLIGARSATSLRSERSLAEADHDDPAGLDAGHDALAERRMETSSPSRKVTGAAPAHATTPALRGTAARVPRRRARADAGESARALLLAVGQLPRGSRR